MAIKRIRIYDMDGTIVCSLHRYRTIIDDRGERIDLDYWRENEYRALDDSLLPLVEEYWQDLNDPETYTIIATARVLGEPDREFIRDTLGEPDYIVSRKQGDTQSGRTLKIGGLAKFFNLVNFQTDDVVFYEDNVE